MGRGRAAVGQGELVCKIREELVYKTLLHQAWGGRRRRRAVDTPMFPGDEKLRRGGGVCCTRPDGVSRCRPDYMPSAIEKES